MIDLELSSLDQRTWLLSELSEPAHFTVDSTFLKPYSSEESDSFAHDCPLPEPYVPLYSE